MGTRAGPGEAGVPFGEGSLRTRLRGTVFNSFLFLFVFERFFFSLEKPFVRAPAALERERERERNRGRGAENGGEREEMLTVHALKSASYSSNANVLQHLLTHRVLLFHSNKIYAEI